MRKLPKKIHEEGRLFYRGNTYVGTKHTLEFTNNNVSAELIVQIGEETKTSDVVSGKPDETRVGKKRPLLDEIIPDDKKKT